MNLKEICNKSKVLDYDEIMALAEKKEPMVTIAMLSFKRFDRLIESLERHLENGTPLNICLRVQCCEDLSQDERNQIEDLVTKFEGYYVTFTEKNLGSGLPRHDMMSKALLDFNTPYILTTDDDMLWQPYCILAQVSLLEKMPEYGLISSTCFPNYPNVTFNGIKCIYNQFVHEFEDAGMIGSATSIYKREIFKDVEYDKNYIIGNGDFDLCMQIHKAGWKIGVLNIHELKSLNNNKANTQEYKNMRYNRPIINKGVKRFIKKWGFSPL